jgi:hypothetical protein
MVFPILWWDSDQCLLLETWSNGTIAHSASLHFDLPLSRIPVTAAATKRGSGMPLYYFNLDDGFKGIADPEGTDLAGESAARAHAVAVAQEIMAHAEAKTRHWLIDVCDRNRQLLFEVLFVTVDPTISHIRPEARRLIEESCAARRSLGRAARDAHATVCRARATIARSRGLPWLFVVDGSQSPCGGQDDIPLAYNDPFLKRYV